MTVYSIIYPVESPEQLVVETHKPLVEKQKLVKQDVIVCDSKNSYDAIGEAAARRDGAIFGMWINSGRCISTEEGWPVKTLGGLMLHHVIVTTPSGDFEGFMDIEGYKK